MNKLMTLVSTIILILLSCAQSGISTHNNLNSNDLKQEYLLYVYYADWCGACQKLDPELETLKVNYEGKVKVNRLNIDRHQKLAQEKGIGGIPTLILSDGVVDIAKSVGYMSYEEIAAWIHKVDATQ